MGDVTVRIRHPSKVLTRVVEHDYSAGFYHHVGLIKARGLELHIHVALILSIRFILAIHIMSIKP